MNNYFKIPGMEFGFSYNMPNSFYEELYPLLERGYGKQVQVFCYGSKSKYYNPDEFPRQEYGYPSDNCDIDLAVPDNPLFENILMFEGWVKKTDGLDYEEGDGITISVWNKEISGHDVQISVRESGIFANMKHLWDKMRPDFYWKYINKRSPHYMGKREVSAYLSDQLSLLCWVPLDEDKALDQNYVYDPVRAAEERMVYWTDVMGYEFKKPKEYLSTEPVRKAYKKALNDLVGWGDNGAYQNREQDIAEAEEVWAEPIAAQANFARFDNILARVRNQNQVLVADDNVAF